MTTRAYFRWRLTGTADPAEAEARLRRLAAPRTTAGGLAAEAQAGAAGQRSDARAREHAESQDAAPQARPQLAADSRPGVGGRYDEPDGHPGVGSPNAEQDRHPGKQPQEDPTRLRGEPVLDPQTEEPVQFQLAIRELQFDEDGDDRWDVFWAAPGAALQGYELEGEATDAMKDRFGDTFMTGRNDTADAYRHAYWSFVTTRAVGAEAAKAMGDAHERAVANEPGERLMDLYNNRVGRELAMDPRNKEREPKDVIEQARRHGLLRTKPFLVAPPRRGETP